MRLLVFLAAIAVLFSLADASAAQPAYAAGVATAELPQGPTARAAGLRMLTWPGKVEAARPRAPVQTASVQIASAPPPAPSRLQRYWDPTRGVVPAQPAPAARPAPAALPTNIYAPAPPRAVAAAPLAGPAAPAPRQIAQASSSTDDYQPTHFYSLHRQYGDAPDPIPLNAQFFASSTPDLAQPPPPVPRTVTTSTGRVIQQAPSSPDGDPS